MGEDLKGTSFIMVYTENIRFEWDLAKAESNQMKHGVSFETAITVFVDPRALMADDEKHSSIDEQRHWIIGDTREGVLVVVYTVRQLGQLYRVMSARKAKRKERKRYEEYKKLPL